MYLINVLRAYLVSDGYSSYGIYSWRAGEEGGGEEKQQKNMNQGCQIRTNTFPKKRAVLCGTQNHDTLFSRQSALPLAAQQAGLKTIE